MTGGRVLRREPHPQDRNEEKEPCACGCTRQDVRHRILQKAREKGIRQKEENNGHELLHLNCTTKQPGWTKVYVLPVCGSLMRTSPEKNHRIDAGK